MPPTICFRLNDHISRQATSPKASTNITIQGHNTAPRFSFWEVEGQDSLFVRQVVLLLWRTAPVSCPPIVLHIVVLQAVEELHVPAAPPW